jgi:hypothetical protein
MEFGLVEKADAVVVRYGGKLFVCNFERTSAHSINFVFFDGLEKLLNLLVEESPLDLGAISIHKVNSEQFTSAASIVPLFDVVLLRYSDFDAPIS